MESSGTVATAGAGDESMMWLREADLTLLEKVGEGGMGVVFTALLTGRIEPVCAKSNITLFYPLYGVVHGSPEYHYALSEVRKEARMLSSLAHPNVLEYIGITMGTDGFPKHIVTELATFTLDKYWEDRPGALTLEVLMHMCEDLFSGLEYLHTRQPQSVIHCDIKPDNIFVFVSDSGVRVKLGDLGLARYTSSSMTLDKSDGGNARYRAPEVDRGNFTGKADVYSVGLVVAELVLQHITFSGCERIADPFELYRGHYPVIQQCISRLSTVHPALAEVLLKCCAPDPADRYTSSEALECIKDFLGHLPPPVLRPGVVEPTALLVPSAEPVNFGDETVNKAVYAIEFSQRVSNEVVHRLAGLQSRGHLYLGETLRAWRTAFDKLSAIRIHKGSALTFGCRLQGFGALYAWRSKAVTGTEPPTALSDAIAAVREATTILQNLSGKEYLRKLVSSRVSVEGLASPDDALIASVSTAISEASLPVLQFQRVAYVDMMTRNAAVLGRLEALGGYEAVKDDREALQSLLAPVCESEESVRTVVAAQLCWEYECSVGEVSPATPASLIQHPTLRALWASMFSTVEEVSVSQLITVIIGFFCGVLQMNDDELASMFNDVRKAALVKQLSHAYPVNNQVSVTKLREAVPPDVEFLDAVQTLMAKGSAPAFVSEPAPAPFIGYISQLEAVHTAVTWSSSAARQHVVTVGGPSGCGLTSFLRRAAAVARERRLFPGGVYLIDLQGTLDVDAGVSSACARIGVRVSERAVTALCAWARWLTSPTLLLIDGGDCVLSKWKRVFEAIALENGVLKAVVGCSGDSLGESPDVLLNGVSESELRSLMQSAPEIGMSGESIDGIIATSRCLPGIAWRLCRQSVFTPGAESLQAVFDFSNLSVNARRLMECLFVFPGTFDVSAVVAVSGVGSEESALELLGELVDAGVIQRRTDGRWFIRKGVPRMAVRDNVLVAFVKHFVGVLGNAERLYDSAAVLAGLALFDLERDNLNVVLRLCESLFESGTDSTALLQNQLAAVSGFGLISSRVDLSHREAMYRGLLVLAGRLYGSGSPQYGARLGTLAVVLRERGKLDESLSMHRTAYKIQSVTLGTQHVEVARTASNLATVLQSQGSYAEALVMLREALEINKVALGPEHPDVALTLNNAAMVLYSLGKQEEALAMLREALEMQKTSLGPQHPLVAVSINNMAAVLQSEGRYDEALKLMLEALRIEKEALGVHHKSVATSVNNIGMVYQKQGKYGDALVSFRAALETQKVALGPRHPSTATTVNNIGLALSCQGKYGEALEVYQSALETMIAIHGPRHPSVATCMTNIAGVLLRQAKYDEAGLTYRKALEIQREALGTDHSDVGTTLLGYAAVLQAQRNNGEALNMLLEALRIKKAALGPQHIDVAMAMNNIASLLYRDMRFDEALVMNLEALEIKKATLGPRHASVAMSMNNIANVLSAQGKSDEAVFMHLDALEIRKEALGPLHPDVAQSMTNAAGSMFQLGLRAEAMELALQVILQFSSILPAGSESIALAYQIINS